MAVLHLIAPIWDFFLKWKNDNTRERERTKPREIWRQKFQNIFKEEERVINWSTHNSGQLFMTAITPTVITPWHCSSMAHRKYTRYFSEIFKVILFSMSNYHFSHRPKLVILSLGRNEIWIESNNRETCVLLISVRLLYTKDNWKKHWFV